MKPNYKVFFLTFILLFGILGIGLGLPGPIDIEKGEVHFFPNIPGWKAVGLRGILRRRLKVPIFLDNDVNIIMIAQGSSEVNISFVVDGADGDKVIRALHKVFIE